MPIQVVVINGYPSSGKDKFIELCSEAYPRDVFNYHTSDKAKYLLAQLGWKGEEDKSPEVRKLLADMVAFSYKVDLPLLDCENYIKFIERHERNVRTRKIVLFVHCREYENIVKFRNRFNAITLFVQRDAAEGIQHENESDGKAGHHREIYDYTVHNNGTLTALGYSAAAFMLVATGRK